MWGTPKTSKPLKATFVKPDRSAPTTKTPAGRVYKKSPVGRQTVAVRRVNRANRDALALRLLGRSDTFVKSGTSREKIQKEILPELLDIQRRSTARTKAEAADHLKEQLKGDGGVLGTGIKAPSLKTLADIGNALSPGGDSTSPAALTGVPEAIEHPKETAVKVAITGVPELSALKAATLAAKGGKLAQKAEQVAEVASKPAKAVKRSKPAQSVASGAKRLGATRPAKAAKTVGGDFSDLNKAVRTSPVGKATKSVTTPLRYPLSKAGRNPGKTLAALDAAAGTVYATQNKGSTAGFTAPVEGIAKASLHPKTYLTTLQGAGGIVTVPAGIAANVGLSGARAAQTGLADAGVDTRVGATLPVAGKVSVKVGKKYSGKEIAAPTVESGKALKDYGVNLAKTYGSGDAKRIEQATEKDYGLWPLAIAGIPGVAGKMRLGKKVGSKIPKANKVFADQAARRHEARAAAKLAAKSARVEAHSTAPIKKAGDRANKGTYKNHIQPADTVRQMVAEGLPLDGSRAAHESIKKLANEVYAERPGTALADHKTPHDVYQTLLTEYDQLRRNKHYQETVKQARTKAAENEAERAHPFDVRAANLHQAMTHGVPLPEARLGGERTTLKNAKRAAQLRINGVAPAEIATTLKVPKAQVQKWLAQSAEQRGAIAHDIEVRAHSEFGKDMERLRTGKIKGKEYAKGLERPYYTADKSLHEAAVPVANLPRMERLSKAPKHKAGELRKQGLTNEDFGTYLEHSVAGPRKQRIAHEDATRFAHDGNIPVRVSANGRGGETNTRTAVNSDEFREGVQTGQVDPNEVVLFDSQHWNQARKDPTKSADEKILAFEEAMDQTRIMQDMADKTHKGKKYLIKPRAKMLEFVAQHTGEGKGKARGLLLAPQGVILKYSPSWLITQPFAEGLPSALSAHPGAQYAGVRAAKGKGVLPGSKLKDEHGNPVPPMSEVARNEIAAVTGDTSAPGWGHPGSLTEPMDGIKAMRRSPVGKAVYDLASGRGSQALDLKKGGAIRYAEAMGHEYKRLQGPMQKWGRAMKLLEPLDKSIAGKPFPRQMEILAKRSDEMERLGNYLIDTSGDWSSIVKSGPFKETGASGAFTFYRFLRYSTQWYFRYARQHPIKAAGLAYLANENEQALRKMYGGDPSFPTGWANAPLYAGTGKDLGKPTSSLPLQRIAPALNAFTQAAAGQSGVSGAISTLNPWASALFNAASGRNPLSGRAASTDPVTPEQFARNFAATMTQWPAIVRHADQATGKKESRALTGKRITTISELFDKLTGLTDKPGKQALKSAFIPFAPQNTARQKQLAQISDLIGRYYAVSGPEDLVGLSAKQAAAKSLDSKKAKSHLDGLFKQYGINTKDPEYERALRYYYENR